MNKASAPEIVELIPELLDRLINLGELATRIKRALHSNGHKVEELEKLKGQQKAKTVNRINSLF